MKAVFCLNIYGIHHLIVKAINQNGKIYIIPIMKEIFKNYISQVCDIAGPRDILFEYDSKSDLILIYRKK